MLATMNTARPTLLAVAHGTRSAVGISTIRLLVEQVRATRPDLEVEVAFLDVLQPDLSAALAVARRPTVVVPLLLSTGFHVITDIPAVVRQANRATEITIADYLGPHPLVIDAVIDRLAEAGLDQVPASSVVLAATGSSRPEAATDLAAAAEALSVRLGKPVRPLMLTTGDLETAVATLGDGATVDVDVDVANYLLAQGAFNDALNRRATAAGVRTVAAPLGAHPAVIQLIGKRYDIAASRFS
jgi:sirohydrochlorin ferrochelatase